jgi:predicted DNA-binding protein with PD1-like motif
LSDDKTIVHAFRLIPGQDLKDEIIKFLDHNKINAGWIITAVGSLTQTNLRFANQSAGNKKKDYFEIVSLAGTVSMHGVHLHLCVSDSSGNTIGGHLLNENIVYTTVEIILGESKEMEFTRENDGTTSWAELQIKKRR